MRQHFLIYTLSIILIGVILNFKQTVADEAPVVHRKYPSSLAETGMVIKTQQLPGLPSGQSDIGLVLVPDDEAFVAMVSNVVTAVSFQLPNLVKNADKLDLTEVTWVGNLVNKYSTLKWILVFWSSSEKVRIIASSKGSILDYDVSRINADGLSYSDWIMGMAEHGTGLSSSVGTNKYCQDLSAEHLSKCNDWEVEKGSVPTNISSAIQRAAMEGAKAFPDLKNWQFDQIILKRACESKWVWFITFMCQKTDPVTKQSKAQSVIILVSTRNEVPEIKFAGSQEAAGSEYQEKVNDKF